jgi:hypothetical protein
LRRPVSILRAIKGFFHGFSSGYYKGVEQRQALEAEQRRIDREKGSEGVLGSTVGCIVQLAVIAVVLLIIAAVVKWAYIEVFQR